MLKLLLLAGLAQAEPLTLSEAYKRALAASEAVASSEQAIRKAEALYRQALGSSLPSFSFRHVNTWQDGQGGKPDREGSWRLFQQNLTGYRELAVLRASGASKRQAGFDRFRAEQFLLSDVAAAFYGLLQSNENVAATEQLLELARKRMAELRERVRVGRTREADALAQESQLASLESQLLENKRLAASRSDLLSYLTRTPSPEPLAGAEPPHLEKRLETYVPKLERRPDVGAARAALETAAAELAVTRAAYLPQIGLSANYYQYRKLARPIAREQASWDGGFTVTVPLFAWGARRAAAAASKTDLGIGELNLSSIRRLGELEIRDAFRDDETSARQLEIQRRAVELARRDYELQRRDEARGLVTSLEVLESLNRLNTARLALAGALLDARVASINLELAAGARPEEAMKP